MRRKCADWCGWTLDKMAESKRWKADDRSNVSVYWFEGGGYCSAECLGWARIKHQASCCDKCGFLTGGRRHDCAILGGP